MLNEIIANVIASVLVAVAFALYEYRDLFLPYILTLTLYRRRRLRISLGAVLRLSQSGHYLLMRNQHRPESFVPFGGVYKYYPSARLQDRFGFEPQTRHPPAGLDLENDLRGYISAKNFYAFMRWFRSLKDREVEPITRELMEELAEVGIDTSLLNGYPLQLNLVRKAHAGIQYITGQRYIQFRSVDVYELNAADEKGQALTTELFNAAAVNPNLLIVTPSEIKRRRARSGEPIGVHSGFLLGDKPTGPEPAPFFE